jgi:CO dehydrogenase/acetyl-CoA synthase delta subunit
MRRLLIVLLSMFMITALMPSAALAAAKLLPPPPEITAVEWTGSVGTGTGCVTSVKIDYANAPGGSTFKVFLYDGERGLFEEVATAKPNKKGVTTVTFERAYTFGTLYIVRVAMVKKAETFADKNTSDYTWPVAGGCPTGLLAAWPAP